MIKMNQVEYYMSGEMRGEGEMLELIDCTSRGSGHQIEIDNHELCVECLPDLTLRKIKTWKYYNKNGIVILTGNYVVLDYIGLPNVKDGIWLVFRDNGSLLQQIVYDAGKIIDLSIFDDDNKKI
jgi:antitoxin component YwqK of YwqJK toxin-antitoxin module